MRAALVLAALLVLDADARAQDLALESRPSRWRIGFETLDAPGAANLGLVGVHHDLLGPIEAFPPLYLGVGGYAGVTGEHGGFLLGGVTLGTLYGLAPGWYLDLGAFLGGGGGQGVDGGGLALRPFVALERAFGLVALRAELADFVLDEFERDPHLALGISLASELLTARAARLAHELPASNRIARHVRVGPRFLWIDPRDATRLDGSAFDGELSLAGLGVDYFVSRRLFLCVEAHGATGGDAAGFRLLSAGLGASVPVLDFLALEAKALAGAGGGDIDSGGGFEWQAFGGARARLTSRLSLEVSAGFVEFGDQAFGGRALSAGLAWSAHPIELPYGMPRGNLARQGLPGEEAALSTTRVDGLVRFYRPRPRAHKTNGDELDATLALLGAGASHALGGGLVLGARGFTGIEDDLGGYSEGWLGARLEQAMHGFERHSFSIGAELGAGGGAGMDVGSGLLGHAFVGWRAALGGRGALSLELGWTEAAQGSFEASSLTAGYGWSLTRAVAR